MANVQFLVLNGPGGSIGIRVKHLPVLPIGTSVDLYLNESVTIESALVTGYHLSNLHGIIMMVEVTEDEERWERLWNELAKKCDRVHKHFFEYLYPQTIDFRI